MRRRQLIVIGLVVGAMLPGVALATMLGQRVLSPSLPADSVYTGDYLVAGKEVVLAGNIDGDVIAAGNSVVVSGNVSGDVIAAGQTVTVSGTVGGSVRVAGNTVRIDGTVTRNVTAIGSSISLGSNATVKRNVYATGALVEVMGTVERDLNVRAADVLLAGAVRGPVQVDVGYRGRLRVSDSATTTSSLTYFADTASALQQGSAASLAQEPQFRPLPPPLPRLHPQRLFGHLVLLFGMLAVGLVLISLVPSLCARMTEEMLKHPLPSLSWGIVILLLSPVLMVALMFTLIGIPLALILGATYLISLYVSHIVAALAVGYIITRQVSIGRPWPLVARLVVGALVISLIRLLPLGGLINLMLCLWALGAMFSVKRSVIKQIG